MTLFDITRKATHLISHRLKHVITLLLIVLMQFIFIPIPKAYAATSPGLGEAAVYSVLAGTTVTNTGATTTNGAVGVSPGTAITGFPPGIAGGGTHSNDASAIAAQADNLNAFGALDQTCTTSYGAQDLTLVSPLAPGVYCSSSAFTLTGNLTLAGSGVWIFKSVSTLITSPGSSVTGGNPCSVWWRVGSSATLDTTTSFVGNILALTSISMNTGATLNGRVLAQNGQVSLQSNTITSSCLGTSGFGGSSSSSTSSTTVCPPLNAGLVAPIIIDSRRVSSTSVFLSWGPYSGTDKFIIQYGLTNGNWLYSTNVTGFSTTISGLPADQPIWVRIAPRNNCSVGVYGIARLIRRTASAKYRSCAP